MEAIVTLICSNRHTDIPIPRKSGIKFFGLSPSTSTAVAFKVVRQGASVHRSPSHARLPAPGESREGAALFGGGLGVPPSPFRSASRQGSGRTAVRPYEYRAGGKI